MLILRIFTCNIGANDSTDLTDKAGKVLISTVLCIEPITYWLFL